MYPKRLEMIFGYSLKIQMVRKSFVYHKLQNNKMSLQEHKDLAKLLGHSLPINTFVYNKFKYVDDKKSN